MEASWGRLEASRSVFETWFVTCALISFFWRVVGAPWGHLGAVLWPSWRVLGASCAHLGASWRILGASWCVLEAFLTRLVAILGDLKRNLRNLQEPKNQWFLNVFLKVAGAILAPSWVNNLSWMVSWPSWWPSLSHFSFEGRLKSVLGRLGRPFSSPKGLGRFRTTLEGGFRRLQGGSREALW